MNMGMSENSWLSLRQSWVSRCWQQIKADSFFAGAALFFFLAGCCGFFVLEGQLFPKGFPKEILATLCYLWLTGTLLSVLVLYYKERLASWKKKLGLMALCVVGAGLVAMGTVARLGCLEGSLKLFRFSLWALGFLAVIRSPHGTQEPYFDEDHPFRVQLRMCEAVLLTSVIVLTGFALKVGFGLFPFKLPPAVLHVCTQGAELVFSFLVCTFCPIYTLSRLLDRQASRARPRVIFPAFLAFAVIPVLCVMSLGIWSTFLAAGWWTVPSPVGGILVMSSWAIVLYPLLNDALLVGSSFVSRILRTFKKRAPYVAIPPIIGGLAFLWSRYRSDFALSSLDVLAFEVLAASLILFFVWAWKPHGSSQIYQLCALAVTFPLLFEAHPWADGDRASAVFMQTLRQHGAITSPSSDVIPVDFCKELTPQENKTFQKAALVLINREHVDDEAARLIQKICQHVQEGRNREVKAESEPLTQAQIDRQRREKLLLQTLPLSQADEAFLKNNPSKVRDWKANRYLDLLHFFNSQNSTYHTVGWLLYPGEEKMGPFFKKK